MVDRAQIDAFDRAFEAVGKTNGGRFWFAQHIAELLGYENSASFAKAVNKAIGVCTTLGISVSENFKQVTIVGERSEKITDFELSRFACYLTAMNGDISKPAVAAAQAYFAAIAVAIQQYVQTAENVERVQIRDEVTDRNKTLSGVAKAAGVQGPQYAFFSNAGYRGMYNMDYSRLQDLKGIEPARSLLDFMGKQELAATLFRLTETEAKITKEKLNGQHSLEQAAFTVGKKVRETMIATSGTYPENLPIAKDIKEVRSGLKKANRELKKIDRKPKQLPPV
jgi:DNA-damage-inducible protein D